MFQPNLRSSLRSSFQSLQSSPSEQGTKSFGSLWSGQQWYVAWLLHMVCPQYADQAIKVVMAWSPLDTFGSMGINQPYTIRNGSRTSSIRCVVSSSSLSRFLSSCWAVQQPLHFFSDLQSPSLPCSIVYDQSIAGRKPIRYEWRICRRVHKVPCRIYSHLHLLLSKSSAKETSAHQVSSV